ncbi:hypothetical protein FUA48_05870 [Flavobacterium alkalisoli]|uniref:Uncharacterized protein n=1 Tax=Flavobacterium alkalisoli TaxID=2602769 RepID=A0A5B9FQ71_9FLAO|nr:hypothetical protein [Flavobacterium alkalisoli]QEE49124.1 hypothetical protein FUA48_05870 [Flavobacterium alkalisoli]
MDRFIERLKQMGKGNLRLLVIISVLIPFISFIVWFNVEGWVKYKTLESASLFICFFGFFIFWAVVRLVLWIKDGYKEDKINK